MIARVWGCRGSVATPGSENVRYGGNTSCIEVRTADGHLFVLDAGTGIRPLGVSMADDPIREIHLLLSHLHMDHLQGLGFFRPLFNPDNTIHIWGPASPVESLEARIAKYLSPPLFPVRLADIPSTLVFHDAPEEPVTIGDATIVASSVTHQGPTVGFRLTSGGRSLAYLPDHEPSLGVNLEEVDPSWISGYEVAAEVDMLFHDAQYGDGEYPAHVGWGHSAIEHVVTFARAAKVRHLVLFHHDPYHDDAALDRLGADAQRHSADELQVSMAAEGASFRV